MPKTYEVFEENGSYYFYGMEYNGQRCKFGPYQDEDKAEWESSGAESMEC